VTVVTDAHWDGRSEQAAPFLDQPLDPERGPTCEVQAISAGERSFLVFRSLHAVMDGLGTLLWAQDVLRAFRGEAPIGHPSAMTDAEFAVGLTDEKLVLPKNDALHPCGRADALTSGNDFCWRRVTIAEPGDAPILASLAVTLAAEARRHGTGPVRFNIPADLRFFHKDQRSTGNVIGTLFVDVGADVTIDDLAQELKDRLRAREHARIPANYDAVRWLPVGALEAMMRGAFAKEHETGLYSMSTTISFLGAVDAATVTAPGFTPTTAFWIPPMADQVCFVACNRFATHMELMLAMPRVLGTKGRFDALLGRLAEVLARRVSASVTASLTA
jgi:hypothetical protein